MALGPLVRQLTTGVLLVTLTLFAGASGIFVRDIGSAYGASGNAPINPLEPILDRFNAYELTYELAIFTTVRVRTTIEALFTDLHIEFESNGSFLTTFRPKLPGVHQVTILNLEPVRGQVGWTILQRNTIPPDLETSMLNPLMFASAGLLGAFVVLAGISKRLGNLARPPRN